MLYEKAHDWEGECSSSCGAKIFRRSTFGPGLHPGLDLTFCRRCQAYTLYRWKRDGVLVSEEKTYLEWASQQAMDDILAKMRRETAAIYDDLLRRY